MSQAASDIIFQINSLILNPLIFLLFGVAILYFLWGVLKFVANAGNSEKRAEGANHILWGVIGIAIMISVFGLMRLIINTLNPPQDQRPTTITF
jgi:hypothetical protein